MCLADDSKAMRQSACWGYTRFSLTGVISTVVGREGLLQVAMPGFSNQTRPYTPTKPRPSQPRSQKQSNTVCIAMLYLRNVEARLV